MYFTPIGRLHTRVVSLIGPGVVACILAIWQENNDYLIVLGVMAVLGLTLDAGIYGWLIGYQPRWLSIVFAVLEFYLIKWILEWPYPFDIHLHTRQALAYYTCAWVLSWLTQQVVLPLIWARWSEDGGEFRRAYFRPQRKFRLLAINWNLAKRQQVFVAAISALALSGLPWIVAALGTPAGYHFTGLLLLEQLHLTEIAQATRVLQGGQIQSPAGIIGWIAHAGYWSVLTIYLLSRVMVAFAWLVSLQLLVSRNHIRVVELVGGTLPVLLLPSTWLALLVVCAWSGWSFWQRVHFPTVSHALRHSVALLALLTWVVVWIRVPSAPFSYIDESGWQTLTWLRQSAPGEVVVGAPPWLSQLIPAFAGQRATDNRGQADLWISQETTCERDNVLFQSGNLCVTSILASQ